MCKCQDYLDNINGEWTFHAGAEDDEQVLVLFSQSLEALEANDSISSCDKCKSRLALGAILAFSKPHLVPPAFIDWCLTKGYSDVDCMIKFGSKDFHDGNPKSSDFTSLLQLITPFSQDGDWFCYYHDDECMTMPEIPEVESLVKTWYPPVPVDKMESPKSQGFDTFHVLQLSDFDYQLDYLIGSESNCSQEVCCIHCGFNERKLPIELKKLEKGLFQQSFYNSSYNNDDDFIKGDYIDITSAGFKGTWDPAHEFGSYRCGSPELLINNTLKTATKLHLKEEVDFDFLYVLFNGGAQVRSNSFEETIESEVKILNIMKHYFDGTPVIMTLGKHDTFPDSQLASYSSGKSHEFTWNEEVYGDFLLECGWIKNDQFRDIKTHNGAYSIVTEYGLKIISLNTNFYNTENYYTFWNITMLDNFGQIRFLVDELIESEKQDQRVWIIGSLPLSSPLTSPIQLRVISTIIKRFSPGTIAEVFFGETHQDGYNVLYDEEESGEKIPIGGAWIAPSVSPLNGNNPGFRFYEIDARTFSVINSYTYYTALEETYDNSGDEPEWRLLYSAREAYEMGRENLWPLELPLNGTFWDRVLKTRIRDRIPFKQMYQAHKYKNSPFTPNCMDEKHYAACELSFCEILAFTFEDYRKCVEERFPALVEGVAF